MPLVLIDVVCALDFWVKGLQLDLRKNTVFIGLIRLAGAVAPMQILFNSITISRFLVFILPCLSGLVQILWTSQYFHFHC